MLKDNWSENISSAYKLGNELDVLDGISLEDFSKKIDIKEIESSAQKARDVLPKTTSYYRQKEASDIFVENFTNYIKNNEIRSIGNELVYQAIDNKCGFELDWKETFKDCFNKMREIVPELPETLIKDLVLIGPINFIAYINTKAKGYLNDKEFVDVQNFNDSYQILFVSSEGLNKNLKNPFIIFQFAFVISNINKTKSDLENPYGRVDQLIKATNMLFDYEGHARTKDLFSVLVLLESAIKKSLGFVMPDTEDIRNQKKDMNLKYKSITDKVHKLSKKMSGNEKKEVLTGLGNWIKTRW